MSDLSSRLNVAPQPVNEIANCTLRAMPPTGRTTVSGHFHFAVARSFRSPRTVDAARFFNVAETCKLTLSITNVFNRVGQKYFGYIITLSINDPLGRRFAVSAAQTL